MFWLEREYFVFVFLRNSESSRTQANSRVSELQNLVEILEGEKNFSWGKFVYFSNFNISSSI